MSDRRLLLPEERRAIASLTRLARRWPQSLTLFSNSGTLEVHFTREFMADPIKSEPIETDHLHIPNDGGDRT